MSAADSEGRGTKVLKDELLRRRREMLSARFAHDPDYATLVLDDTTPSKQKLYLMYLDNQTILKKKKSATAYVGYTRGDVRSQVRRHNDPRSAKKIQKTKHGAGNWRLVMVIFVSESMAKFVSAQNVLRTYWESTHGIKSKVARAMELVHMFDLRYYIPSNALGTIRSMGGEFDSSTGGGCGGGEDENSVCGMISSVKSSCAIIDD